MLLPLSESGVKDSNCFLITLRTLFTNKAVSTSIELANKAYAHLFTASADIIDPVTTTNPFAYSMTAKLCYTSIVFIGIIINISIFKKSITSYRQFQVL